MFGHRPRLVPRIGEYRYANGREGTHPIRRNIAPGPPKWIKADAVVAPVEAQVRTPEEQAWDRMLAEEGPFCASDALHERDRSFESELARLEVWR